MADLSEKTASAASSFFITTDSGADFSYEVLSSHGIVPYFMQYEVNGELRTDTMRPDHCHQFYEEMRAGAVPHTSQITTSQFEGFWRPLLAKNPTILHISLGSGVSGTYHNACLAAEELEQEDPSRKIYVCDSTLCSTGYGMLCLKAAEMRDAGCSASETFQWVDTYKININTWYTTDELKYLQRSGRCSKASAIIGGMLHICPILNLDAEGHLIVQERVRGLSQTIARIHKIIGQTLKDPDPSIAQLVDPQNQTLYICHSDIPEKAREFGEGLRKEFGFRDIFYTYIGTTIGANCGPGLMAAFYYAKPRTMKGYEKNK